MDGPGDLRMRQSGMDLEYLKSVPGLLKVAEILCLLLAFACLSGFTLNFTDDQYGGRFDFFYFATITSWLLVIVLFVMFLLRLYERLANVNWNLVMAVYSPVTAFLLLISSALVLDTAIYFRRHEEIFDGEFKEICNMEKCGNVEAAGAFGIISMVLFGVDTILYCMKNRNTGAAQPRQRHLKEEIMLMTYNLWSEQELTIDSAKGDLHVTSQRVFFNSTCTCRFNQHNLLTFLMEIQLNLAISNSNPFPLPLFFSHLLSTISNSPLSQTDFCSP
ncbi:hypothetical protein OS493_007670 [Desmophyllum pertusum]|uniref:MARVEL domain-containing protein n=1 Tax=Desmophyllum pertusum TaxID=174260 RepID=A0A9W9YT13_9CNID|nr:hypothetical protein OS493_007670 [Desmophyllum pertusum]